MLARQGVAATMTWAEPLRASVRDLDANTFTVSIQADDGHLVAGVRCVVNLEARFGAFGSMFIVDPTGGPRQKLRAMVMLVRHALQHADELGVTRVWTPVRPALRDFAQRLTGREAINRGSTLTLAGELQEIRTHVLDTTDDQGNDADGLEP